MIAWIFEACSSETACLNSTPRLAARSVATMTAVGVARPSASGQAITTAVTANVSARSSGSRATSSQTRNVSSPEPTATSVR